MGNDIHHRYKKLAVEQHSVPGSDMNLFFRIQQKPGDENI